MLKVESKDVRFFARKARLPVQAIKIKVGSCWIRGYTDIRSLAHSSIAVTWPSRFNFSVWVGDWWNCEFCARCLTLITRGRYRPILARPVSGIRGIGELEIFLIGERGTPEIPGSSPDLDLVSHRVSRQECLPDERTDGRNSSPGHIPFPDDGAHIDNQPPTNFK